MSLEEASIVPLKDVVKRVKVGFVGSCNDDYCSPEVGVPMIRTTNLTKEGIKLENLKYINNKFHVSHIKSQLNFGDILIARHGHNGLASLWEYKFDAQCLNVVVVEPNESLADKYYLTYLINSPLIQQQIKSLTGGSVQSVVNTKDIADLLIPVHPLSKQKEIANFILLFNKKIAINKSINKNLEELAKAIYRYHFIDFKPYALGGLMKHSSQGMIPKDWSVQSIEEFVDDMKNGGTPKRGESDYWDNGTVPWLKTGEINNNIIIKSEEHITELGLKNSSAKLLPINSIIMALYGKGTAARIGLLKFEATTNQACCAMICNDFNKTLFLYLFLLFNQKEIENLASGSVQQNLSKDLIANLELVVPPIEIIDNLPFKEIFDNIANNYFEIEYLINLRDTLLPKLMSGEIDVSKINCDLKIIIRKIYIKSSKLFLWRYLSENQNYIKNTKSNETLLKSRTIHKINKFLAKFNARYRYYRQQ